MTTQDYEKMKGEIADGYLKKFKDELWRFKSLTVFPIEWKLKKIMISDVDLEGKTMKDLDDLWRWRTVLGVITPKIANDIFDFLKEKQSLIIQAETSQKLEELRNEVVLWKIVPQEEPNKDKEISLEKNKDDKQPEDKETSDTEIEDSNKPEARNSVRSGVIVWVTWATAWKTMEKSVNRYNDMKFKKELDFKIESSSSAKLEIQNMQSKMDDLVKEFDQNKMNPKISQAVRNNLDKSSKKFAKISAWLSDAWAVEAWDARGKLGKDMPIDVLNALDPKTAAKLAELDDGVFTLIAQANTSDEVTEILAKNGIKNVDSKVIEILVEMKVPDNIKAFTKVLRYGKKLSPLMKWLSCIGALDLLLFGFDVWMWNESMNAAEFVAKVNEARAWVKQDKALWELRMWAASIVLTIGAIWMASAIWASIGSVVPWPGTAVWFVIWVAIGVMVLTVQEMVNQLYYDKLEFYTHNKEDYIRKERTDIKQAILHCAKGQDIDANHKLTDQALNEKWINTFQDAWEAIIFQEEMDKYNKRLLDPKIKLSLMVWWYFSGETRSDYIAKLSAEEKIKWAEEDKVMNELIAKRMEYVKQFITKTGTGEQYTQFIENIRSNTWIAYIEKIIGNSEVYVEMNDTTANYIPGFKGTIEEYKKQYGEKLQSEYPEGYTLFDTLYKADINKFEYLCTGINIYPLQIESSASYTPEQIIIMKKNKEFVEKFYHYKNLWLTIEHKNNVTIDYMDCDYSYIDKVLIDFDTIDTRTNLNTQNAIDYFSMKNGIVARLNTNYQVSSSTGQNILYRMAREFHGYDWDNDMFHIMRFYKESDYNTKGIYYDDERMVNDNWSFDGSWNIDDVDKNNMTVSEVYNKFSGASMLDSAVDVADQEAVKEFRAKIKKIIKEEIAAKSPVQKKKTETDILEFVKSQSKIIWEVASIAEDGSLVYSWANQQGYIEMPYHLVIAAKKAKIGDIEKFLFKYENGKLVALSSQQYVDTSLQFTTVPVIYEKVTPLREDITPEEKSVIAKVDFVKERLSKLRGVESAREDARFGWHEDEIDIPEEIEREMSKKVYEWENLKESLLYLSVRESTRIVLEKWKSYYDYFNWTYMGMLATISQFKVNNNLWSFDRMSQAWAWIGKEKYKIDDKGKITFDHLLVEDDEKEYITTYIKKAYQSEKKTVEELLKSEDIVEKQQGERMLDQIMISVFESEVLWISYKGDNIYLIDEQKNSNKADVEKRIEINFKNNMYIVPTNILAVDIDSNKVTLLPQEVKKITNVEKVVYDATNLTLKTIIATMNSVDRWHGRGKIKFTPNTKESTETVIVWKVKSRSSQHKVSIDVQKKQYTIDGLSYVFTNPNEFAYTVNLLNRIQGRYLKNNPAMVGKFFFGDQLYPNTLFADRDRHPNDVDILDGDTVKSKFSRLEDWNDANRRKFLRVINNIK